MEIKPEDILRAEIIFKQVQLIGLEQAEVIKKLQKANQELIAEIADLKETLEVRDIEVKGFNKPYAENEKLKDEIKNSRILKLPVTNAKEKHPNF